MIPDGVRTKRSTITNLANASNKMAMASVTQRDASIAMRIAAIAEAASGKLTAHKDTRNGQHTAR